MAETELTGTGFEKGKGEEEFLEVEELIKETLKESKIIEKTAPSTPLPPKQAAKKEEFTATRMTPAPPSAEKPAAKAPVEKPAPLPKSEAASYEATFKEYKSGDTVKGTVIKVDHGAVLVDIKYKADGIILPEELSERSFSSAEEVVKVGDVIDVFIENLENKEGYVVLSKKRADYESHWQTAYDAFKNKQMLEGKVIQVVRGGLVVDCSGIRGFIPASQVMKQAQESLDTFKDKTLPVKVIEVNRRQGKIIMSHKLGSGAKEKQQSSKVFEELEVGQVRHGKVTSLKNFGAFVDLGGIEGLIHLSELSWKRVKHPSVLLKVGQELDVFVLGVDQINKKVALGLKELQDDPWEKATEYFKPGQTIKVKILRFAKFGAFAELDHDLEGLIHVSEMSNTQIQNPEDAGIKINDVVEVRVLRVLPEEQKIGLSIKAAAKQREREEIKQAIPETEETPKVTIADMIAQKEKDRAEQEEAQEEAT
ncbi:MAG: S1 RNA-binding domain-containing protein [Candidatus Margulisbacteria bacterium]|nr:S1 RNA-binding domain-containing protein [Candidatus Margulisiibacteriota bacterium]